MHNLKEKYFDTLLTAEGGPVGSDDWFGGNSADSPVKDVIIVLKGNILNIKKKANKWNDMAQEMF